MCPRTGILCSYGVVSRDTLREADGKRRASLRAETCLASPSASLPSLRSEWSAEDGVCVTQGHSQGDTGTERQPVSWCTVAASSARWSEARFGFPVCHVVPPYGSSGVSLRRQRRCGCSSRSRPSLHQSA